MTLAGEGYRQVLGVVYLCIMAGAGILAAYITRTRGHIPPLNTRSNVVGYMVAFSNVPLMICAVIEIVGESAIPCRAYFWVSAPASGILVGAAILQFWRIIRMYGYEDIKKQYKYGKVKLSTEQADVLKNYLRWHSDKYLLIAQLINMTVICLLYLPIFLTDPYYNSDNYGCRLQQPPWWSDGPLKPAHTLDSLFTCWFVMTACYTPVSLWLYYKLHVIKKSGKQDSVGLLQECFISTSLILNAFTIVVLLMFFEYSTYMTVYNYLIISALQPALYCFLWIIYPSLYNTHRARRIRHWFRRHVLKRQVMALNGDDDKHDMLEMLHTTLGYRYMLQQCKSEFAEETLVCLKSIWQYKNKPTYPKMMQLHQGFIEEYSPFQVNIAASNRYKLSKLVMSIQPECSLIEITNIYDGVETELTNLLLNNSYIRFKRSERYRAYMDGTPLVDNDQSDTGGDSSVHTGTTGGRSTMTAGGGDKSRVSRMPQEASILDVDGGSPLPRPKQSYAIEIPGSPQPGHRTSIMTGRRKSVTAGPTNKALFDGIDDSQADDDSLRLMKPGGHNHAPLNTRGSMTNATGDVDDDTMNLMNPGRNKQQPVKRQSTNARSSVITTITLDALTQTHKSRSSTSTVHADSTLSLPGSVDISTMVHLPSHLQVMTQSHRPSTSEFDTKQTYVAPRMRLAQHKPVMSSDKAYTINVSG